MFLKEIMQKRLISVSPEATIRDAAKLMKENKVGYLLVTNGKSLRGCVTDRDIAISLADAIDPDTAKISAIMEKHVVSVAPDTDVFDAARIMADKKVRRLPVVEKGRLLGLVSSSDIACVLEEEVDNFLHLEEVYVH